MTEQTTVQSQTALPEDDEISLIDLAIALGEEKATILMVTGLFTAVAVALALQMPNIYSAKTVMVPPQQQQSGAASALASLGGLAGLAGSAAGIKSPDEMYVAFIKSEGLQNAVIEKLSLQERYKAKSVTDARAALGGAVRITPDKKSGLITIEADDQDPAFAAQLANAHVDELRVLMGRLAVTDAQQRRMFYEQQIKKVQSELAEAEQSFRKAKAQSGMQVTAVLAETGVRASAELRGQIAAREVQMSAMSRFATAQNPDVQRLGSELSALRAQLAKLEQGSGVAEATLPLQQQAVKSYRDVKVQEAMLEVLIKQYELARVDEAKEGPLLQQLDVATAPERKAKPKRAIIVLAAAFGGLFLGVLLAFIRRAMRKAAESDQGSSQIALLQKAWSFKR
ncbi:GNVR domain-containing protein [Limnohabitans sp. TS-CS-82]|uniref:GumC family protein n=1 Tax=Limnohabitans sp. TS-CS-82 TaxID=2094193 RepID=UPI001374FDF9|nr:GNVR domain-containing protein [Limnohabitans sp. TS-CS-82]